MLVSIDVKGLEWVAGTFLSQDKVANKEIWDGVDQHSDNQHRFGLPSRLIAKKFVFRLIYGGSAYAYANDNDFEEVGFSQAEWQGVIDEFYKKYYGWASWHKSLIQEATTTGRVVLPTGRVYLYSPERRGGDLVWPRTRILNYPVQGFGADLMCLARIGAAKRLRALGDKCLLLSSVHDSIVVDCADEVLVEVGRILLDAVQDIPKFFQRVWGKEFNLPITGEIKYGPNLADVQLLTL